MTASAIMRLVANAQRCDQPLTAEEIASIVRGSLATTTEEIRRALPRIAWEAEMAWDDEYCYSVVQDASGEYRVRQSVPTHGGGGEDASRGQR